MADYSDRESRTEYSGRRADVPVERPVAEGASMGCGTGYVGHYDRDSCAESSGRDSGERCPDIGPGIVDTWVLPCVVAAALLKGPS